jgi:two-component system, cell cycle response regulator CtrA
MRRDSPHEKQSGRDRASGGMDEPDPRIIDVFIYKLRKKLAGASNGKSYIETMWGHGYVLRDPSEDEARIPLDRCSDHRQTVS